MKQTAFQAQERVLAD